MKRSIFFKPKLPPWLVLTFLVAMADPVQSQSVIRQSISPFGSSSRAESLHVSSTAGQAYHTSSGVTEGMTIRPGFQQAPRIHLERSDPQSGQSLSLQFYPNPAQDRIILETKEELDQVNIRIMDPQGRLFYSRNLSRMLGHQIDCDHWPPGHYLLDIEDRTGKKQIIKIIIYR